MALKTLATFSFKSQVKPRPIVTGSHTFTRASRQQHVFASSFVSFTGFSVSFVIDQSADIFGFGFAADTRLTSVLANKEIVKNTSSRGLYVFFFHHIRSNKPKTT